MDVEKVIQGGDVKGTHTDMHVYTHIHVNIHTLICIHAKIYVSIHAVAALAGWLGWLKPPRRGNPV